MILSVRRLMSSSIDIATSSCRWIIRHKFERLNLSLLPFSRSGRCQTRKRSKERVDRPAKSNPERLERHRKHGPDRAWFLAISGTLLWRSTYRESLRNEV